MEINYKEGCALCDATWGEYWEEVEGKNRFFCCDICATAFKNLVTKVKAENAWPTIDSLEITGNNNSGRKCTATYDGKEYRFYIKFYNDGRIFDFHSI